MEQEIISRMALDAVFPTAVRLKHTLVTATGSATHVLRASQTALQGLLNSTQRQRLASVDLKAAERQFEKLQAEGAWVLAFGEPGYPDALAQIADPPLLLYGRGDAKILSATHRLAVVGSRGMSSYGKQALDSLLPEICRAGFAIVSGLAFGVDACAHELALVNSAPTIAVQAQGVLRGYPRTHQRLYEQILSSGGVVVSEFLEAPPGIPEPTLFPRRNRIISGLSDGVLVVEAKIKSGALITARCALEQDRDVFAVPGSILHELSSGCNELIAKGAKLVSSANAVLEEYGSLRLRQLPLLAPIEKSVKVVLSGTPLECQLQSLCSKPASLDDLADETGEPAEALLILVSRMELDGRLMSVAGGRYLAA
jgi:DNA processing protein